jgi:hypothetical protein
MASAWLMDTVYLLAYSIYIYAFPNSNNPSMDEGFFQTVTMVIH